MAIERVEWQCPQCERRYAIPAHLPRPALCPKCSPAEEPVEPPAARLAGGDEVTESDDFPAIAPVEAPPRPGAPPTFAPSRSETEIDAPRYQRKYPALRMIALFYRCLAALAAVGTLVAFIAAVVNVFQADDPDLRWAAAQAALATLVGGLVCCVTLLAFAELIHLAIDVERNTRSR